MAWEKLRLVYNAVLAWVVVTTYHLSFFRSADAWADLIGGAVIANICFCAGPCGEGYLRLLGANRHWARGFLFISGLALSCFLFWFEMLTFKSWT